MTTSLEIASLGRLIETGKVKEAARNKALISRFDNAMWIERSSRKSEWVVRDGSKVELQKRLNEISSTWIDDFEFIRSINLDPYDPSVIDILPILRHCNMPSDLTNRRNWNAITGISPKHTAKLKCVSQLTNDWIIRFRPNPGLKAVIQGEEVQLDSISELFSECIFPERMWLNFEKFDGELPRVVITCENLGAFIDLPVPSYVMVVFSPGKDIVGPTEILKQLPDVTWFHFGDLDPYGIDIAKNLAAETQRDFSFYVPKFAEDYLPGARFDKQWGDIDELEQSVFVELKRRKRRIYQEVFMLDRRLSIDLDEYCRYRLGL